jgi:hypothetical protein
MVLWLHFQGYLREGSNSMKPNISRKFGFRTAATHVCLSHTITHRFAFAPLLQAQEGKRNVVTILHSAQ